MTEEMQLVHDACEAAGIAASELAAYRITADQVRLVAKDGRKWVADIVRLNPEFTATPAAVGRGSGGREVPRTRATASRKKRGG